MIYATECGVTKSLTDDCPMISWSRIQWVGVFLLTTQRRLVNRDITLLDEHAMSVGLQGKLEKVLIFYNIIPSDVGFQMKKWVATLKSEPAPRDYYDMSSAVPLLVLTRNVMDSTNIPISRQYRCAD